jgi:ABC-type Fe3+ transport system permease subunit
MPAAVEGALVGLAIGVVLVLLEFMMLKKDVNQRATKYHRKAEFDVTERRRMATIARFACILPFAFAAGFWLIWG